MSTNSFVSVSIAANSAANTPRPGVPIPDTSRRSEAADYGFVGSHLRHSSLGESSVAPHLLRVVRVAVELVVEILGMERTTPSMIDDPVVPE